MSRMMNTYTMCPSNEGLPAEQLSVKPTSTRQRARGGSGGGTCIHTFDSILWLRWFCARLQLNYAETRLTQLEGCHCERTCSANGLVYRDKELWVEPENCRNCACKVSVTPPPYTVSILSKSSIYTCTHHKFNLRGLTFCIQHLHSLDPLIWVKKK